MAREFKYVKADIINAALNSSDKPCSDSIKGLKAANCIQDLIKMGKEHFIDSCRRRVINGELLLEYQEEFAKEGIYYNQDVKDGYLVVDKGAECIAEGRTLAVVFGNSSLDARDYSQVYAYDNSTVDAWDDTLVLAYDNSKVTARDYSKVKCYDHSTVSGEYQSYIIDLSENCTTSVEDNAVKYTLHESNLIAHE